MGLEFMPIFEEWALDYDAEVNGGNPEYQEVFTNYWQVLAEITAASGETVLEFGSGTGNLTETLVAAGKTVYPIEPSPEMRNLAAEKAALREVAFLAGDMEHFPVPPEPIDTIVSNLVFHHLTTEEKSRRSSVIASYCLLAERSSSAIRCSYHKRLMRTYLRRKRRQAACV